jgi:hypothetical protein
MQRYKTLLEADPWTEVQGLQGLHTPVDTVLGGRFWALHDQHSDYWPEYDDYGPRYYEATDFTAESLPASSPSSASSGVAEAPAAAPRSFADGSTKDGASASVRPYADPLPHFIALYVGGLSKFVYLSVALELGLENSCVMIHAIQKQILRLWMERVVHLHLLQFVQWQRCGTDCL